MNLRFFCVLVFGLLWESSLAKPQNNVLPKANVPRISDACLSCICQSNSGAESCRNGKRACYNGGGGYFCGPFQISWAYWADAGKPNNIPNDSQAFEKCLNSMTCSEQTVRQYMQKFGQDCDGNGIIDCSDFGRIHKTGGYSCKDTWVEGTDYWKQFQQCQPQNERGQPQIPSQIPPANTVLSPTSEPATQRPAPIPPPVLEIANPPPAPTPAKEFDFDIDLRGLPAPSKQPKALDSQTPPTLSIGLVNPSENEDEPLMFAQFAPGQ